MRKFWKSPWAFWLVLVVGGMCLYPPWLSRFGRERYWGWVFDPPPDVARVDFLTLGVEIVAAGLLITACYWLSLPGDGKSDRGE